MTPPLQDDSNAPLNAPTVARKRLLVVDGHSMFYAQQKVGWFFDPRRLLALAAADPANAETYAANATAYAARIRALEAPLKARLAKVPEPQRWLVSSEGAFSYLAADLGWREAYLWPINAEEQGTPQQVRRLIDLVRTNKVPVVFSESTISDRPARQIARETGARYGGVLYVDSLSAAGGPVPTYLRLIETTVETIAKGFGT